MRRLYWLGLAGLCLVAACGKGGNSTTGAGNAAPAAPVDQVITAAQFPVIKAGYWAHTEVDNGGAPQTSYVCEHGDPINASDMGDGCPTVVFKHMANGDYDIDAKCFADGVTKNTHIVFKGDLNSSFTVDGLVTGTAPGTATTTDTHHIDSHYACPCPSG